MYILLHNSKKPGQSPDFLNILFVARQQITEILLHLFFGIKIGNIHLVCHGTGQRIREPSPHFHVGTILAHDRIMIHYEILTIATAAESTIVTIAHRLRAAVKSDHVGPDLVDIRFTGVVIHFRSVPAGRPHVDLQAQNVTLLAQTFLIFLQNKVSVCLHYLIAADRRDC